VLSENLKNFHLNFVEIKQYFIIPRVLPIDKNKALGQIS